MGAIWVGPAPGVRSAQFDPVGVALERAAYQVLYSATMSAFSVYVAHNETGRLTASGAYAGAVVDAQHEYALAVAAIPSLVATFYAAPAVTR